jgi:hypothetical protein
MWATVQAHGVMSNKEANNNPVLCPVKGQYYGLYIRAKAPKQFPRLFPVKETHPYSINRTPVDTGNENLPRNWGKYTVTVHRDPRVRKAYIQ